MSSPAAPAKIDTGFGRIVRASRYSMDGLRTAYRNEGAFRQECWAAIVLLPAAFWLGRGWVETALLAGSVIAVMVVELLNSAVEAVVDRVSLDRHLLSKNAKDMGSAAVFLAVATSGCIWLAAAWNRFVG